MSLKLMQEEIPLKTVEKMETKTWSKSISGPKGNKTVRVEQAENGYIVSIEKDKQDKEKGWIYECKKYISTTNPFDAESAELPNAAGKLEDFLKDM